MNIYKCNVKVNLLRYFIACVILVFYESALAENQSRMQNIISEYESTPSNIKSAITQSMIDELLLNPLARKTLDSSTKKMIEQQLDQNLEPETIFLATIVGIDSAQERIKLLASKPIPKKTWFGNDWAARLMMARLGDQVSLSEVLSIANQQDFHTKSTRVAIDFKYVPQLSTLDFLKNQLFSDERLEPVKETVQGSRVANYAMASLAVLLENFPLDYRDHFGYTDDEVIQAREWMSKQTKWKFR